VSADKPPARQYVRNIVVHVGDYLLPDVDEHGTVMEFRLFDRGKHHFATIVGHNDPDANAVVVTDIRWVGTPRANPNPPPEATE
jgi:hypothetical protein